MADTSQQLRWIKQFRPNVIIGKPAHLLNLGIEIHAGHERSSVEKLILSGERHYTDRPKLEELWLAQCFDRYGLTEVGSVAAECSATRDGMHLLETEFIAEVIDPDTGQPVAEGDPGELVLTNLGRPERPVVRYRTGDRARLLIDHGCPCGRSEPQLIGGITRLRHTHASMAEPLPSQARIYLAGSHSPAVQILQ